MKRFIAAVSLMIALISSGEDPYELKIGREYRLAQPGAESSKHLERGISYKKLENGFVEGSFYIPLGLLLGSTHKTDSDDTDPFSDSSDTPPQLSPKQVLEEAGIKFEEGASVTYIRHAEILTAVLPEDQMERLAIFLELWFINQEEQMGIRAEIYEMPRLMALQLLESTIAEGSHTPERNAAFQAVKDGRAKLVACPSVIARSGQRARITSGVEIVKKSNNDDSGKKRKPAGEVPEKELFSGMSFEVDPVLGADSTLIDLNVSLQFAGSSRHEPAERVKKELTTQVTLKDGEYFLIGNWPSRGSDTADLEQLIFITVSVHYVGAYGPVEKVSD